MITNQIPTGEPDQRDKPENVDLTSQIQVSGVTSQIQVSGVDELGLDEVTLAVLAVLLFGAAVVFFGVQNPVVVAPVACFSFSSFP